MEELVRWEKRHGIAMEKGPTGVFQNYLRRGNVIFATLLDHPRVSEPAQYVRCSVVLQRGVVVYGEGRETLFLKAHFHSARDSDHFVNFAPRGGIRISFPAKKVWFPLELTRFVQEPASYVVLDILTKEPLQPKQLPDGFRVQGTGKMEYEGQNYSVTRVAGKLIVRGQFPDLELEPPRPKY